MSGEPNPPNDLNSDSNEEAFASTRLLSAPSLGLGRARRISQFLRISTSLLIALGCVWAAFAYHVGHYPLLIADFVLVGIGAVTLFMMQTNRVLTAIHWLLISLLVWICLVAFTISGSGVNHNGAVHYWLIMYIVGLHFVLFNAGHVVQTFYVSVAILIFIVVEYDLISLDPTYGFPAHDTLFSHGLTLGLVLIAIAVMMRRYISDLGEAEERARVATMRSNELLHSVLPPSVVQQVQKHGGTYTESAEVCSILFADIVGFTPLAGRLEPEALVNLLNKIFSRFDALTDKHEVEKIKTIGDGYMVASGIPRAVPNHAERLVRLGIDMQQAMEEFEGLSIRIGINSGFAIAGIIGQRRIAFDLWGETVNLASRMESHGFDGRVQVTAKTYALTKDLFTFDNGRVIEVKGKGPMQVYLLES